MISRRRRFSKVLCLTITAGYTPRALRVKTEFAKYADEAPKRLPPAKNCLTSPRRRPAK